MYFEIMWLHRAPRYLYPSSSQLKRALFFYRLPMLVKKRIVEKATLLTEKLPELFPVVCESLSVCLHHLDTVNRISVT